MEIFSWKIQRYSHPYVTSFRADRNELLNRIERDCNWTERKAIADNLGMREREKTLRIKIEVLKRQMVLVDSCAAFMDGTRKVLEQINDLKSSLRI